LTALATDPAGRLIGPVQAGTQIAATRADLVTVASFVAAEPRPKQGDSITFRVEISNRGPENASAIAVETALPPGLTYRAHAGDGRFNAATGNWTIERLAANGGAVLNIETRVDPGTTGATLTAMARVIGLDQ